MKTTCQVIQSAGGPGERECGKEAAGYSADGVAVCAECEDDDTLKIVHPNKRRVSRTEIATAKRMFPPECPAFMVLECSWVLGEAYEAGEIVEGTFNQDNHACGLLLAHARPEKTWPMLGSGRAGPYWIDPASGDKRMDGLHFLFGKWECGWPYRLRLAPLTRAAREMLRIANAADRSRKRMSAMLRAMYRRHETTGEVTWYDMIDIVQTLRR